MNPCSRRHTGSLVFCSSALSFSDGTGPYKGGHSFFFDGNCHHASWLQLVFILFFHTFFIFFHNTSTSVSVWSFFWGRWRRHQRVRMAFAQAILSRSLPLQLKGVTLGPGATGRVVLNVCPEGHLLINKVVTGGLFGLNLKRCVRCNEQLKTVGAFWGIEPDRTLDATYQFWDDFISWSFGLASRSLWLEEWPGIGSPQLQAVRLSPLRVAPWHFPAEVDRLIETNSCQVLVVVDGSWSPKDFTHRVCGHSIHLVDPHAVNTNDTFHSDDTFLSPRDLELLHVSSEVEAGEKLHEYNTRYPGPVAVGLPSADAWAVMLGALELGTGNSNRYCSHWAWIINHNSFTIIYQPFSAGNWKTFFCWITVSDFCLCWMACSSSCQMACVQTGWDSSTLGEANLYRWWTCNRIDIQEVWRCSLKQFWNHQLHSGYIMRNVWHRF